MSDKKILTPVQYMAEVSQYGQPFTAYHLEEYMKKVVKYTLERVGKVLEQEQYGEGSVNRDEYKARVTDSLFLLEKNIIKELKL